MICFLFNTWLFRKHSLDLFFRSIFNMYFYYFSSETYSRIRQKVMKSFNLKQKVKTNKVISVTNNQYEVKTN